MANFEVYQHAGDGRYRWRLVAANGRTIADSSQGYVQKADCLNGIGVVRTLCCLVFMRYGRFHRWVMLDVWHEGYDHWRSGQSEASRNMDLDNNACGRTLAQRRPKSTCWESCMDALKANQLKVMDPSTWKCPRRECKR